MSVSWFELPPPADLGDGWSLRALTAAQMLACRDEGEAQAREERDKALWAGAALLAQVLLKEGEPAFPSGGAVLDHLTVGQIESLTRRWWVQDQVAGQVAQDGWPAAQGWEAQTGWPTQGAWPDPSLWTRHPQWPDPAPETGRARQILREQGENAGFDMARFLELGGTASRVPQEVAAESLPVGGGQNFAGVFPQVTSQVLSQAMPRVWPQVLSRSTPTFPEAGAVAGTYPVSYREAGMTMPQGSMILPAEGQVPLPGGSGQEELPQGGHSVLRVLVPEAAQSGTGVTIEELDRAVERDARRYDGGSSLY